MSLGRAIAVAGAALGGYGLGHRVLERDERDNERFRMEKDRYEREKADAERKRGAWRDLADLVDEYGNPKPLEQPGLTRKTVSGYPPAAVELDALPAQTRDAFIAGTDQSAASAKLSDTANISSPTPASSEAGLSARSDAMSPQARNAVEKLITERNMSPEDGQQLRDRVAEGLNTERIGFGMWRNPNLFKSPDFNRAASRIFLRAGMPEGVKWLERGAQAVEENGIDALKRLIGGDVRGAEAAFNQSGNLRVLPGSTRDVGNGRYELTLADGTTRTIDPRQMLMVSLKPNDFFTLGLKERELESKAQERRDTAAYRERKQVEVERHNRATVDATTRGQNLTDARARQQVEAGRIPVGWRRKADGSGIEPIPGYEANATPATREYQDLDKARAQYNLDYPISMAGMRVNNKSPGKSVPDFNTYYGTEWPATRQAAGVTRSQQPQSSSPPQDARRTFKSPDEVRGAFAAGRVSEAEAAQILRDQFGFE